ncbi:MAG: protein kinase [Thermoanaerobaculaceae bacterium]
MKDESASRILQQALERGLLTPEQVATLRAARASGGPATKAVTPTPPGVPAVRPGPEAQAALADTQLPRAAGPGGGEEVLSLVGRYELTQFLGEGGMGRVWKARDPRLQRHVALKLLRHGEPELVERLIREARAQAQVEHANVCRVYEVGEDPELPFIAMQLVVGPSLREVYPRLAVEEKVLILRQVASAVHAAHRTGLVHRDIKPANVLLERRPDGGWHPYVVDFGLAREQSAPGLTATGAVVGTAPYMAPEQARGETSRIDRRTDVWGLGVTLYEVLTGRLPFEGDSTIDVLVKALSDDPVPPRRIDPSIPTDLERIVLKCLEKEPQHRYASARDVEEELGRFLDGEPILARRTHWTYRAVKKARKHRGATAALVVAMLACGVIATLAVYGRIEARREAATAQRFLADIERLEDMVRRAHSAPPHDIRPEQAQLRRILESVRGRLEAGGARAKGSGHYALGRGHLVLQEYGLARDHLEAAWRAGLRGAPGGLPPRPGDRCRLSRGARRRPAGRHPGCARAAAAGGRGAAQAARARVPQGLLGSGGRGPCIPRGAAGPVRGALRGGRRTGPRGPAGGAVAVRGAQARGRRARRAGTQARGTGAVRAGPGELRGGRGCLPGRNRVRPKRRGALRGRVRALARGRGRPPATRGVADPDDREGRRCVRHRPEHQPRPLALVQPHGPTPTASWRTINATTGRIRARFLEQAVELAEQALARNPRDVVGSVSVGWALYMIGDLELQTGGDPQPYLDRSVAHFQAIVRDNPTSVEAHNALGYALDRRAKREVATGHDPTPTLRAAIAAYGQALALDPAFAPRVQQHRDRAVPPGGVGAADRHGPTADARQGAGAPQTGVGPETPTTPTPASTLRPPTGSRRPSWSTRASRRSRRWRQRARPLPGASQSTPTFSGRTASAPRWRSPRRGERCARGGSRGPLFHEGEKAFTRSLELHPRSAETLQSGARLFLAMAQWDLATGRTAGASVRRGLEICDRALAINPRRGGHTRSQGGAAAGAEPRGGGEQAGEDAAGGQSGVRRGVAPQPEPAARCGAVGTRGGDGQRCAACHRRSSSRAIISSRRSSMKGGLTPGPSRIARRAWRRLSSGESPCSSSRRALARNAIAT